MVGRPPTDHLPTTFLRCSLFTITGDDGDGDDDDDHHHHQNDGNIYTLPITQTGKLSDAFAICQHRIKTSEVQKNDRLQTELQLYLNSWLHGTFCAKYNALVRILQCHFFAGKQYFTHPQTSRASKSISCLWDPP